MPHSLVSQLRFARSEFVRCLTGVSGEDACRHAGQMNCLSWTVGHLANQEHFFWVLMAQGKNVAPGLNELVGYGQPPSTPRWEEMWELWHKITGVADVYLETLTPEVLRTHLVWENQPDGEEIGIRLLRNIDHYWFHLGEAHAIRQILGHTGLPQFVGDLSMVRWE